MMKSLTTTDGNPLHSLAAVTVTVLSDLIPRLRSTDLLKRTSRLQRLSITCMGVTSLILLLFLVNHNLFFTV